MIEQVQPTKKETMLYRYLEEKTHSDGHILDDEGS